MLHSLSTFFLYIFLYLLIVWYSVLSEDVFVSHISFLIVAQCHIFCLHITNCIWLVEDTAAAISYSYYILQDL